MLNLDGDEKMPAVFVNLTFNCLLTKTQLVGTGEDRQPPMVSLFPLSWLVHAWGASALLWSAKSCEALGNCGVKWGVIHSHGLPTSADVWVFCERLAPFESSSTTGPSWLTGLCASYCSTVFHSSFDIWCSVCEVAIRLRKTPENPILWLFEASYFGDFGV